jgi:general secretion pathway protein A
MYRTFYGLRERPFMLTPDPAFLFPSRTHRKALDHLEYGLGEGMSFTLLTGEVGSGKTTLLRHVLARLGSSVETALVFNTRVTPGELLRLVMQEYELSADGDKAVLLDRLNDFLIERYAAGTRCVLVIDEAQNLSFEALEEVRLLSNLQTETEPLLLIVLAGQPELARSMRHPDMRQLAQRVSVSFHLSVLSADEVGDYIAHRLRTAGAMRSSLFDREAVRLVHEHSGGVPRIINNICDACLLAGYADGLATIGAATVRAVLAERADSGLAGGPYAPVEDAGRSPAAPAGQPRPEPAPAPAAQTAPPPAPQAQRPQAAPAPAPQPAPRAPAAEAAAAPDEAAQAAPDTAPDTEAVNREIANLRAQVEHLTALLQSPPPPPAPAPAAPSGFARLMGVVRNLFTRS